MSRLSAGAASQLTLNRTYVFCSWAFGARVCWLTASVKACGCTNGPRPGRDCYPAAARGAGNRLELEARALIPRLHPQLKTERVVEFELKVEAWVPSEAWLRDTTCCPKLVAERNGAVDMVATLALGLDMIARGDV